MSRPSLSWPLGVIVVMLGLIALIVLEPVSSPQAAPLFDTCGTSGYPACPSTAYPAASQTLTATSGPTSQNATSTTAPTAAATTASNGATSVGSTTTPSATLQPTATSSPTPSITGPLPTPPQVTPIEGAIACLPGTTVLVEGQGPPYTSLLLYFDGKVVGGGTSDEAGNFGLRLVMNNEKTGTYLVQVRVRSNQRVLRELVCGVQSYTPTPSPLRQRPP